MGENKEIVCYLIPGLGSSEKIFENLRFPPEIKPVPIHWMPYKPDQSLVEYSKLLLPQIDPAGQHVIVGFSFGGALAVELSKLSNFRLTVVVSSSPTVRGIPSYLRWASRLGGNRLLEMAPFLPKPLLRYFLGMAFAPLDKRALTILCAEISSLEPGFVSWAVDALMNWKNLEQPGNLLHIHGSADRIFPIRCVSPNTRIQGAGHFAVFTHADQISRTLSENLFRGLQT